MRIDEHIKLINEAERALYKIELQLIVFKNERKNMQNIYSMYPNYKLFLKSRNETFAALYKLKKLRDEYKSIINKLK